MADQLENVIEQFGLPESQKVTPVSRETVRSWIQSDDIQVLGAVYSFIVKAEFSTRIVPPLTFEDYKGLVIRYFARCLRENPNEEWTHSRYEAGWDLASWLGKLSTDANAPKGALDDLCGWLGQIYLSSDHETRRCIVDATLEHAFENPEVLKVFATWKEEPTLASAYSEATEWAKHGGKTGLAT